MIKISEIKYDDALIVLLSQLKNLMDVVAEHIKKEV